ncbi:MAG: AAA family ATPase [Chloroflexi bacterium]|nr:AAA family ATPase [Chloroflexota bacterium]
MKLHIKNFRSIRELDMELAPITVLYGHNGTGKSSALYAPLTLKNIVTNPNQHVQGFFNYGFTSLGEFSEVIFDHNPNNELELGITIELPNEEKSRTEGFVIDSELKYRVACLKDANGSFQIGITEENRDAPELSKDMLRETLPVKFPYKSRNHDQVVGIDEYNRIFGWNGISAYDVTPTPYDEGAPLPAELKYVSETTIDLVNLPAKELTRVSFVPLGRGFFQPIYSLGYERNGSSIRSVEQEVTNLLANNRRLEYDINHRMEQILNKNFRIRNQIGSSDFSLDSIDRQSRVAASLVNEGFGVNQLVYMLAKVLHPDSGIVCIEEPEIHLHPTAIRRLARTLADIVQEEPTKHLIISTHSEQFILSLLALVAEDTYSPDNLAIYHVTKKGKESEFHRQQVNENGQVEGGLATFMEGELEDMKAFLGV